jgi:hypothetical protein
MLIMKEGGSKDIEIEEMRVQMLVILSLIKH